MKNEKMFDDEVEPQEVEKKETDMIMGTLEESKGVNKKLAIETKKLDALIEIAMNTKVTCLAEYESSKVIVNDLKTAIKDVRSLRMFITRPIDALKAYFMDKFEVPVKRGEEAQDCVDSARSVWFAEQEKKRIVEQERLCREAKEQEEKERARLEKQAEAAAKKGDAEKAEGLKAKAAQVFVPVAQAASVAQKGDVVKMEYTISVENLGALPLKYHLANEKLILKDIEESKGTIAIPGVKYTGAPKVTTLNRGR